MKMILTVPAKRSLFSLLFLAAASALYSQSPVKQNPAEFDYSGKVTEGKPALISRQFSFTEGASTDRYGNVFFTDQPNDNIWEYDTSGRLSVFLDHAGRSNGMYFDARGNLVTCADEHDQLWSVSPGKKVQVLVKNYHGKLLNGPNDLWITPRGDIFFTDPYYQRSYWTRTHPDIPEQDVYFLRRHHHQPKVAAAGLEKPNGIVGTPDGKYLYVADIQANKTWKYRIGRRGKLTDKKLFVNQGSDGMTLDAAGNVYLTGHGVTVYDAQGLEIEHIPVPEPWTANLCFGGKNKDQLFITASTAIYIVPMRVKGVE